MAEIVISEFMDETAVNDLRQCFDVHYEPNLWQRRERLSSVLGDSRAWIVRNQTRIDDDLLGQAPSLEAVGRLGVGTDNIDMVACERCSIVVLRATGSNSTAVAEYVITGLLILFRGAFHATHDVSGGKWPRLDLIGREIHGKRLGLIGFGRTAREVAWRARALGMSVAATDKYVPADSPLWDEGGATRGTFEEVLATCDAVSLHVPLTEETRHLIDAAAIARMQRGAVLVNTARGDVVDDASLVAELRSGALGGALLDVFSDEPLRDGSLYQDVPNLLLTPHIAGLTAEANARVSTDIASQISRCLLRKSVEACSKPPCD